MNPEINKSKIVDVVFGKNVKIVSPVNLYGCIIGEGTFVGPFVEIQKNACIGKRCKIQSHSLVCSLVTIRNDCFIGHGVMFINDLFSDGKPSGGEQSKWKECKIGKNVNIGSNSTILPISICNNVVIGAGSVVTKDIVEPGIYAGNPAKLLRKI